MTIKTKFMIFRADPPIHAAATVAAPLLPKKASRAGSRESA
jgi:hypothetical protein